MRWWFAIKKAWEQRAYLKRFMLSSEYQIHALEEVTPQKLEEANIAVLVLDFDGVLAGHDAKQPTHKAEEWLRKLSQNIGEQRIAILTNKPKPERVDYFAKHFPSILLVQGTKKKPYPEGLLKVATYKGVAPHRLMLIDDRLLTGMLATCLAYTHGWYFYPAQTNFWRHPIKESFFAFLRLLERTIVRSF